jgi:hypothetical protein
MASLVDSDDEEVFALASRLSRLSSDGFDEQIAQLPPKGSASADYTSHLHTPNSDEKDDLALTLRTPQLLSDDSDEQVTRPYRTGSSPTSEQARSSTPPNESDGDDLDLALNLSQLPVDTFDEQRSELNRRRESRTAIGDILTSLLMAMSPVEVRTTSSLSLGDH